MGEATRGVHRPANVVGSVVRGSDFWGREQEIAELWRLLRRGSVLLTAPRRHGKSSLMNALVDAPQAGWQVEYLEVEYVESPAELLTEITAALLQRETFRKLFQKAASAPGTLARWLGGVIGDIGVGAKDVGELKISLRGALHDPSTWQTLTEQLLGQLERIDGNLLLVIDEFPMMIANFLDRDEAMAIYFLKWFRALRHRQRGDKVRFLLGGSVNIEPRLERLRNEALLNDLERLHLRPLPADVAVDFVTEVLRGEDATFEPGVPAEIVRVADCGIHFFLQVLMAECLAEARQRRRGVMVGDVEPVYRDRVLGPLSRARFSHYHSRLREHYRDREGAARAILDHLTSARVASSSELVAALGRAGEPADAFEDVATLLESDYYLERDGDRFTFTSGFLRDWWLRNATRTRGRA